ncbi:hypothetical protein PNI02_34150 [Pseudoalteromonas nigrifaciens]|nr:hypothetical protein PNI02_34150 [Pseudoalteromonas nigrifaciens]
MTVVSNAVLILLIPFLFLYIVTIINLKATYCVDYCSKKDQSTRGQLCMTPDIFACATLTIDADMLSFVQKGDNC